MGCLTKVLAISGPLLYHMANHKLPTVTAGPPGHCFDHFRQVIVSMANEGPPDESECYLGCSITRVMIVNNQIVNAVWNEEQLETYIYFPVLNGCFERSALTKWNGGIYWERLLLAVRFT